MRFYVSVGGRELVVETDGERVTVDGEVHSAALAPIPGTPLRQLLLDDRPCEVAVEPLGGGRWGLLLGGERAEVEVVDERTRHIRTLAGGGTAGNRGGVVRAPMPGLVLRVQVAPGQTVAPGEALVVLEAMKMENELRCASAGEVRAVLVEAGQAVEKGQPLVEIVAPHP